MNAIIQVTKVGDEFSSEGDIEHGLPQGSKLSNLLFILFINDIVLNAPGVNLSLYADDALLYIIKDDIDEAVEIMNEALSSVSDWIRFNRMSINIKKCSAMIINDDDDGIELIIDDEVIENAKCVKYLGVMIDNQLNFLSHVEMIKKKINKRVGLLGRLSNKMTYESKIIFLKSIILPIYDYCSSILMLTAEKSIIQIQRCVNKAMRIVLKAKRKTSIESMIEKLNITSVKERILLNCLKMINKVTTKGIPVKLAEKFKKKKDARTGDRKSRLLRNNEMIDKPKWRNNVHMMSIFYKGVELYNDFSSKFKNDKNFIVNCKEFISDVVKL